MPGKPKYTTIPPLFVFGDSLLDTGRLRRETLGLLPPDPPYYKGRISNGAVAVEYLADFIGLPFKQSHNYAIAGANSGRSNINDNPLISFDGFRDQVDGFIDDLGNDRANSNSLYVVWIGANDLFNGTDQSVKTIKTILKNLEAGVTDLAKAGARYITLATSPNLGRTPFAQESDTPIDEVVSLVTRFNTRLTKAIATWQTELRKTNLILADMFPLGEAIARDPDAFGFTNTETAYLKDLKPVDPSADPDKFVFWDQVHPTTRVHELYGEIFETAIIDGIKDDVAYAGSNRSDRLVGYSGDDHLKGRFGDDELLGHAGNDKLLGSQDNDWLEGGAGKDLLRGGQGADTFVVQDVKGKDKIADFTVGDDQLSVARGLKPSDITLKAARTGTKLRSSDGDTLAILRDVSLDSVTEADLFNVA